MVPRSTKMVTKAPKAVKAEQAEPDAEAEAEAEKLMPFPETLKIGPHTYDLGTFDMLYSMQNSRIGEHDYFQLEIKLLEGMKPSMEAEVMMHEVVHSLWETTGLRGMGGEFDEEHAVTVLAKSLITLFQENPAWLAAVLQRAGVGLA